MLKEEEEEEEKDQGNLERLQQSEPFLCLDFLYPIFLL